MRKIIFLFLAAISFLFYSCETEVDIIGDYKETTVVYGLLNQDSTTFIKVNKAFLGKGNALTMAKIEDSSTYNNIIVQMEEWNNDQLIRTINLNDTVIDNKQDGLFYNPYQKLYYTVADLNEDYIYELKIQFEGDQEDVTAIAELVHDFSVSRPPNISTINFMTESQFSTLIRWNHAMNAGLYNVIIRFNFKETFVGQDDTLRRSIDWNIGSVNAQNLSQGSTIELNYFADQFYDIVAEKVPYGDEAIEEGVFSRITSGVDFVFQVASEDFYTYLDVNTASNSIVQDRPQYSNINNGLGLFASRYFKVVSKKLHMDTQFALEEMNLRFVAQEN